MLVALGDSITAPDPDAADEPGLAHRPWAAWLADAAGLPLLTLAAPGAYAPDLLPWLDELPEAAEIGAVHIGVNDVRDPAWDAGAYAAALAVIAGCLAGCCARLLFLTVPLDLGRPRAGAKVADCNAIIRAAAAATGAAVCDLDDFAGEELLLPDAVHPRATGQREIARRAAAALGIAVPA